MKVFDFTNGTKGRLLDDITIANSTGGWLVEKNGITFKVELADPKNVDPVAGGKAGIKWSWVNAATNRTKNEDRAITAEYFGVGAICFCTGESSVTWHIGHPEAETQWEWHVVGTTDWNREACKSGILKATKQS
jgi:hypothetical protein